MAMRDDGAVSGDDVNALLARAARELRDEQQPWWVDVSSSIRGAVRATGRRSWPVDAVFAGSRGFGVDTLRVADHVVRMSVIAAVRSALPDGNAELRRVDLDLDDHVCLGVNVDLAIGYGADLVAVSGAVTAATGDALARVLGGEVGDRRVAVHVSDVIAPDG